jgi:putative transposase
MHFEPGYAYHVYNRGNNKQRLFFSDRNYQYFLDKIHDEWLPYCEIDRYCLMPNHFHFICIPNELACIAVRQKGEAAFLQKFSATIGHTQSSYAWAINKQQERTGSLFQKKAKNRVLHEGCGIGSTIPRYYITCAEYIEQNPVKAGLVKHAADWKWSSIQDRGKLLVPHPERIIIYPEMPILGKSEVIV